MMIRLQSFIIVVLLIMSGKAYSDDWTEKIKLNGDFRYRHEIIDQEDKDKIRHRHRIRARLNVSGQVSDEASVNIGISSGSDDPVSNNQTLSGSFTTKEFLVDIAYFSIKPNAVKGLNILGGKMKNPFYKPGSSELIWDSDIRQEGINASYKKEFEDITLMLNGCGFWIEERSQDDDSYMAGGQASIKYNFNDDGGSCTAGASYVSYGNIRGRELLWESDEPYGNSFTTMIDDGDTLMNYSVDYELIEVFGAVSMKMGEIPVTFFGDYVTNNAADSLHSGWLVGISAGKTKKPGSWSIRYNCREVKKDAVVGLFADSDFRGGGTDAKGHEINFGYQLMDKTTLAVTYFNNEIGLDEVESINFQRWQIDLKFKF